MRFIIFISISLVFFSCDYKNNEKTFQFIDPYSMHHLFLGIDKEVKKVSYSFEYHQITEGGYFRINEDNYFSALYEYPLRRDFIKYSANLNSHLISNLPITGHQYLINALLVLGEYNSKNVEIELEAGKIQSFVSINKENEKLQIECYYDDTNRLVQLDVSTYNNGAYSYSFKNKGGFLEQIVFNRNGKSDTTNLIIEKRSDNEFFIKRAHLDSTRGSLVSFKETDSKKIMDKIIADRDQTVIEFENNKIISYHQNTKENTFFNHFTNIEYKDEQISKITESGREKYVILYDLNKNNLIKNISIETDKEKMKSLELNFDYKYNNRNDWIEMTVYLDQDLYNYWNNQMDYIRWRLKASGYEDYEIALHQDIFNAKMNLLMAQDYCSKTVVRRELLYE